MNNEKLRIIFVFAGAWWNAPLDYSLHLDGTCLERKEMTGKILTNVKRTFGGVVDQGWHELKIRLESKLPEDVYVDPGTGKIIRNKYLELKQIYINDFGMSQEELLRLGGVWYSDNDVVTPIKSCTIHEPGTFVFRFKSPMSYWALQNMNTEMS